MIHLKSPKEIEVIARGGLIIADLFEELESRVQPGTSTAELDRVCEDFIRSRDGAAPAFKGLYGFPGSVCISINEEVVHGIPSSRRLLQDGDVVSVDVGVRLDGWCSDSAFTFQVGEVSPETRRLLEVTRDCLWAGISMAVVGNHVGDIGAAVQSTAEAAGFSVIRDLVGHGVGRDVHEEPQVPNIGRPGFGPRLQEGMVLAIEPMISAGSHEIRTLEDRWTVVTVDGARSAHFEHTVAVCRAGPRILTISRDPAGKRA